MAKKINEMANDLSQQASATTQQTTNHVSNQANQFKNSANNKAQQHGLKNDVNYIQPPLQLVHDMSVATLKQSQHLPPALVASFSLLLLPVAALVVPLTSIVVLPWLLAAFVVYTVFFGWNKASNDVKSSVEQVWNVKLENVSQSTGQWVDNRHQRIEKFLKNLKETAQQKGSDVSKNHKGSVNQVQQIGHNVYYQSLNIAHHTYVQAYEMSAALWDMVRKLASFGERVAHDGLAKTREHPLTRRAEQIGRDTSKRAEEVARDVSRRVEGLVNQQKSN